MLKKTSDTAAYTRKRAGNGLRARALIGACAGIIAIAGTGEAQGVLSSDLEGEICRLDYDDVFSNIFVHDNTYYFLDDIQKVSITTLSAGGRSTTYQYDTEKLGGIYFIFLDQFDAYYPTQHQNIRTKYISGAGNENELYIKIDNFFIEDLKNRMIPKQYFDYNGESYVFITNDKYPCNDHPNNKYKDALKCSESEANEGMDITKRMNIYENLLTNTLNRDANHKVLGWVYNQTRDAIAVVMEYGQQKKWKCAIYGEWGDQNQTEANKYGNYNVNDKHGKRVYMSEIFKNLTTSQKTALRNGISPEHRNFAQSLGLWDCNDGGNNARMFPNCYGDKTWSYSEIMSDGNRENNIYPYLAWRDIYPAPFDTDHPNNTKGRKPVNSGILGGDSIVYNEPAGTGGRYKDINGEPKTFDSEVKLVWPLADLEGEAMRMAGANPFTPSGGSGAGRNSNNYKPVYNAGMDTSSRRRPPNPNWQELPNTPDNTSKNYSKNGNQAGYEGCPDKDWYFDLFLKCASEIYEGMTARGALAGASMFNVYSDYLEIQMMDKYDPTIYEISGGYGLFEVDTNLMPFQPALYKSVFGDDDRIRPKIGRAKWDITLPINDVPYAQIKQQTERATDKIKSGDCGSGELITRIPCYVGKVIDAINDFQDLANSIIEGATYSLTKDYRTDTKDVDERNIPFNNGEPRVAGDVGAVKKAAKEKNENIRLKYHLGAISDLVWQDIWTEIVELIGEGLKLVPDPTGIAYGIGTFIVLDEDLYQSSRDKGNGWPIMGGKLSGLAAAETKKAFVKDYIDAIKSEMLIAAGLTFNIADDGTYYLYKYMRQTREVIDSVGVSYNDAASIWNGLGYSDGNIYRVNYNSVDWNALRVSKSALASPPSTPLPDGVRRSFSRSLSDAAGSIFESVYQIGDAGVFEDRVASKTGPLNPVIKTATRELALSALAHDETAGMIAGNAAQLDSLASAAGYYAVDANGVEDLFRLDTSISNQTYLSNMTVAAGGLIRQQNMKLESEKARTLGAALAIMDADARDRVTYNAYMNARRTDDSLSLTRRLVRDNSLFNRQSFEPVTR